jgi:Fe-S-cluster containining protein
MSHKNESKREADFFDTCSRCTTRFSCCLSTNPPITEKRRRVIEAYLKKKESTIVNAFVQTEYVFPKVRADGYCIFHDTKTRKCLIHPVKPETCVAGPVTFDINKKTEKIEWHLKTRKACPLAGELHENEPMLIKHLESAKKEILRLAIELDSNALKTILKIEEPETFKIGEDNAERGILEKLEG